MGDEIAQRGAGALQLEGFRELHHEHVRQLAVGRFKRAEPLAAFDVRREGIGYGHRLGFGFVEAVAEFVDEVAVVLLILKTAIELTADYADDADEEPCHGARRKVASPMGEHGLRGKALEIRAIREIRGFHFRM